MLFLNVRCDICVFYLERCPDSICFVSGSKSVHDYNFEQSNNFVLNIKNYHEFDLIKDLMHPIKIEYELCTSKL